MLKEPKQVPKEPKVDTFQKYTQCFAYGVSWINMDAPEERTALPSINSFLLRTCLASCFRTVNFGRQLSRILPA